MCSPSSRPSRPRGSLSVRLLRFVTFSRIGLRASKGEKTSGASSVRSKLSMRGKLPTTWCSPFCNQQLCGKGLVDRKRSTVVALNRSASRRSIFSPAQTSSPMDVRTAFVASEKRLLTKEELRRSSGVRKCKTLSSISSGIARKSVGSGRCGSEVPAEKTKVD